MKNYLLLALAAVALCFTACKKDNPGTDKPKVVAVTGVSLNTNAVALEVDDSVTLTATVAPANATNKSVEWSVADDAIATVKDGVVKAVAIGETTVTVTTVDGGFTASATITVAEGIIKVTGVTLDKSSLELEIGDSDTLTATVAPDDATNKAVSWSSANDAIATVEDGVVTAVAAGETTVTVTTADGAFKATANVVVKAAPIKVTGVSLNKTMVALEIGESVTVEATVTPETAVNKAVEWSVANTAIATVIDGVVTGVAAGETTLTVTTVDGGHTATIPVKVVTEKVAVTGIEWQKTFSNVKEGEFVFFTAMISPDNATDTGTTWVSDNPEVATIGEITTTDNFVLAYIWGVAPGKATISVTTNDGGFKRGCPIVVDPIVKVSEINLWPTSAEIEVGQTQQLAAAVLPSDAENKKIEWSSSDTSVATVNTNGLVTGIAKGEVTITATAKDGSGVTGSATIKVVGKKPTSITFNGETLYDFDSWQGKVINFKEDLNMKVLPEGADLSRIEWRSSITSSRGDEKESDIKYEVTEDNVILSYAHSTNWVAEEKVWMSALVDGVSIGRVTIHCQNRAVLFASHGNLSEAELADISMRGNTYNWDNGLTLCRFIKYYKEVASSGNYDKYQIPPTEYTLTSGDPSKVKVTMNDDGMSWKLERLNTSDLTSVTLTYTCGRHTQTYTINLIP